MLPARIIPRVPGTRPATVGLYMHRIAQGEFAVGMQKFHVDRHPYNVLSGTEHSHANGNEHNRDHRI